MYAKLPLYTDMAIVVGSRRVNLLGLCRNLIEEEKNGFRLAHLSVKEYLEKKDDYDPISGNALIAEMCLSYLLEQHHLTKNDLSGDVTRQYAALWWPQHCQLAEFDCGRNPNEQSLRILVKQFLFSHRHSEWNNLLIQVFEQTVKIIDSDISHRMQEPQRNQLRDAISEQPNPLFVALVYGFENIIQDLLKVAGETLRLCNRHGRSALRLASEYGRYSAVKRLLDAMTDADITAERHYDKETALFLAAKGNHADVMELLIKAGFDIEKKTPSGPLLLGGRTPLTIASLYGHQAAVRLLIENKVNVNAMDGSGDLPLHAACFAACFAAYFSDDVRTLQLLLDGGADIDVIYGDGIPVIHYAARENSVEVVRLLINNRAGTLIKDPNGRTALHAATVNDQETTKFLIDLGMDIDAPDNEGNTALHKAADDANEATVQILIDHGADVSLKNKQDETALSLAAGTSAIPIVRLLIDRGADLRTRDQEGRTALHRAAARQSDAVARLLIDRGADLRTRDQEGRTALHWAATGQSDAVARLLIDRGADLQTRDQEGRTALHLAATSWSDAVAQLLIDRGADLQTRDQEGRTALHWAATGLSDVARLLIDRGADLQAQDQQGNTPLHWALEKGRIATARLLIDREADIGIKNNQGMTALQVAEIIHVAGFDPGDSREKMLEELVKLLKEKEAEQMSTSSIF
jgi:ankyrin repeat protein